MGNNTFLSDHDFQEEENMSNYIGEEIELEDGRIHSYKSHLGNGYRVSHNKHSVPFYRSSHPHANRGYYTDVDCARRQREEAFKEEVKMSLYNMAWQHLAKPLCRTCLTIIPHFRSTEISEAPQAFRKCFCRVMTDI